MRPKQLTISGLNSFVEEEIIDFAKLTEKELFGIFGPTGSGKSTILDAITLALYGEISRDTKEFINKEKEELFVSFEFAMAENNNYTVERKMKISSSGGYKTTKARLIICEQEKEEIVDQVREIKDRIEEIIGLNHEDFMRTVVLPQGKFSRFLKLTGRDRRDMLERILGLEEFGEDLMKKLKRRRNFLEDKQKNIEATLQKYEEIDAEKLKKTKKELENLQVRQKNLGEELEEVQEKHEKYKKIREKQKELEKFEEEQKKLADKKDDIEDKESRVEKVQEALRLKKELKNFKDLEAEIAETKEDFNELKTELEKIKKEKERLEKQLRQAVDKKEEILPELTEKKVDIKAAMELKTKSEELRGKIKSQEAVVKNLKAEREERENELEKLERELKDVKTRADSQEKRLNEIEVKSEFREKISQGLELENKFKQKKEQLAELEGEVEELKQNIENNEQDLQNLRSQLLQQEAGILAVINKKLDENIERKDELEKNLEKLRAELAETEKELAEVETELEKMKKQNMAHILACDLEADSPCPVCGSNKHPSPAEEKDLNIEFLEGKKAEREEDLDSLQEKIRGSEQNLRAIKDEIANLQERKKNYLDSFLFAKERLLETETKETGDISDLDSKREDLNQKINTLKGELKNSRENLSSLQGKREKLAEEFASIKQKYQKKLELIECENFKKANTEIKNRDKEKENLAQELQKLKTEKEELEDNKEEIREKINELKEKYLAENKELEGLQEKLAEQEAKIARKIGDRDPGKFLEEVENQEEVLQEEVEKNREKLEEINDKLEKKSKRKSILSDRLERYERELEKLDEELNQEMKKNDLGTREEVEKLLKKEDSLADWQEEIADYKEAKNRVDNNIKRLKQELGEDEISGKKWRKIIEHKEELESERNQLQEQIGGMKEKIAKMEKEWKVKQKKQKEKQELEHKFSLVKEINKLVRGKSFVEFVAIRQLRYIAREASKRLMQITNNRYRLELDEQGEFVIADLYNGGVKRDCNTLSGGETFLTSLSLALALSSQIQLKGKTNLEFFFLDEGFGTLDSSMLDTVMNSLEKLQDEDLTVGLISHVEELKQRVPIKLIVDPARPGIKGSTVEIKYGHDY